MIQRRWRTFARPETVDQLESPTTAEALAVWLLGTTWILISLWMAWRGEQVLVAPMLAGGLLVVWAWQRDGWLRGVPWVLLAAATADAVSSVLAPGRRVLGFLDMVVSGTALVAVARRVAHRRPSAAARSTPSALMPWPVACGVAGVIVIRPSGPFGLLLHAMTLSLATFLVVRAASRDGPGTEARLEPEASTP